MYEIFEKLLKERSLKTSDVVKGTGLSSTFFTEWKKGKSKLPNVANLIKVADYFDVSLDYLVGRKRTTPDTSITDEYVDLIDLYSKLNDMDKDIIMKTLRSLANK